MRLEEQVSYDNMTDFDFATQALQQVSPNSKDKQRVFALATGGFESLGPKVWWGSRKALAALCECQICSRTLVATFVRALGELTLKPLVSRSNQFCKTAGNIWFDLSVLVCLSAFGILLVSSQSSQSFCTSINRTTKSNIHLRPSFGSRNTHLGPRSPQPDRPHQAGLTAMIGSGEDGDAGQDTRIALSFTQLRVSKFSKHSIT